MINLSIKYYYGSHFFGICPKISTQGNLSPETYTPISSLFEFIQKIIIMMNKCFQKCLTGYSVDRKSRGDCSPCYEIGK